MFTLSAVECDPLDWAERSNKATHEMGQLLELVTLTVPFGEAAQVTGGVRG